MKIYLFLLPSKTEWALVYCPEAYVYILQLAVHTVQRNWISILGRYLTPSGTYPIKKSRIYKTILNFLFILVLYLVRWGLGVLSHNGNCLTLGKQIIRKEKNLTLFFKLTIFWWLASLPPTQLFTPPHSLTVKPEGAK